MDVNSFSEQRLGMARNLQKNAGQVFEELPQPSLQKNTGQVFEELPQPVLQKNAGQVFEELPQPALQKNSASSSSSAGYSDNHGNKGVQSQVAENDNGLCKIVAPDFERTVLFNGMPKLFETENKQKPTQILQVLDQSQPIDFTPADLFETEDHQKDDVEICTQVEIEVKNGEQNKVKIWQENSELALTEREQPGTEICKDSDFKEIQALSCGHGIKNALLPRSTPGRFDLDSKSKPSFADLVEEEVEFSHAHLNENTTVRVAHIGEAPGIVKAALLQLKKAELRGQGLPFDDKG
ncbi:hypothetical protein LIER_30943 [Lithospermum erythrorhizon]|uniref:Uncharacterized protein n=1 Tax=Lithospermum erythrorhizon TaxID=34254 RepID=A0AAV3RPE9_LITER